MKKKSVVILLSGLLFANPLSAAPNWDIDERALPPGMTMERARRALEQADAASAAAGRREQQAFEQRAQRVERAAQRYQAQLKQAIDADPQLKAEAQRLEARMKALGNDPDAPQQLVEGMAREAQAFRAKASARAGIDQGALQNDIRAAIHGPVRSRSAEPEMVTFDEEGAAVIQHANGFEPTSGVSSRGLSTVTLAAPFPYLQRNDNLPGNQYVSKADGRYRAEVYFSIAGSGTNRIGLAHIMTVPPRTTGIRVLAQLPDTPYRGLFINYFGGAGHRLSSRIEVTNGSSLLCSREVVHLDHWWVVLGFIQKQGFDTVALDCTLPSIPAAGTDLVVRFIGQIYAYAWGGASNAASIVGAPQNIRIEITTAARTRLIR